jgi:hypothetical protein
MKVHPLQVVLPGGKAVLTSGKTFQVPQIGKNQSFI